MMENQIINDQFFMLILCEIASHFDRLGERIKDIISRAKTTPVEKTREELNKCVEKHIELIKLFDMLNDTYSFALLVQVVLGSIVICFCGLVILVNLTIFSRKFEIFKILFQTQDFLFQMPAGMALLANLSIMFLPCLTGDMIKESVSSMNHLIDVGQSSV